METVKAILIPYLLFILFSLILADHAKNFRGANKTFHFILHAISFIAWIGLIAVLISLGIKEVWYLPLIVAIGGYLVAGILKAILDRIIEQNHSFILSFIGIIMIPTCLIYIMKLLLT